MRRFSRKTTVLSAGLAFLVIGGGVAFAYWTSGGSGTSTAATGSSSDVTVMQTSTVTPMGPGVAAQPLSGNFDNNLTDAVPVYVATVEVTIDSVDKAVGAAAGTCDDTDYTLTGAAMAVNAEVPVGDAVGLWSGATIKFNDKATVNQDACQGATVHLLYTVS